MINTRHGITVWFQFGAERDERILDKIVKPLVLSFMTARWSGKLCDSAGPK